MGLVTTDIPGHHPKFETQDVNVDTEPQRSSFYASLESR